MKTANASLRTMTLALLLTGVVGSAWAVGTATPASPVAALSAATPPATPALSTMTLPTAPVAPAASAMAPMAASDAPAVGPIAPVAAGTGDERAETTLKKVGALQAKYALRKIQVDIDKLDAPAAAPASSTPSANPLDALRAANGASPLNALPTPISVRPVETKPVVKAAPAPTPESTMKAVGTYSTGDSAYADMLIDNARTVAVPGATLSNGYHVDSVNTNFVAVSLGKKHLVLPVVPGPTQAMASGSSVAPTLGSPLGSDVGLSRFNQLSGPGMPANAGGPMIIPTQPVGPTAGGFPH